MMSLRRVVLSMEFDVCANVCFMSAVCPGIMKYEIICIQIVKLSISKRKCFELKIFWRNILLIQPQITTLLHCIFLMENQQPFFVVNNKHSEN